MNKYLISLIIISGLYLTSCNSTLNVLNPSSQENTTPTTNTSVDTLSESSLPNIFKKFDSDYTTITTEGNYYKIETKGIPNHPSPYYASTHTLYAEYSGSNTSYKKNPNTITEQDHTYYIHYLVLIFFVP